MMSARPQQADGRIVPGSNPAPENRGIHHRIIGMRVDASTYQDAAAQVIAAAEERRPFWLCPAGVHTILEAHRDVSMGRAMETASLVTSDGMPLVWTLKWLGVSDAERVYGPTLAERVMDAAEARGISIGFYGSSAGTLRKLTETCGKRWPRLNISYAYSPPFRPLTPQEDMEIMDRLKASRTRILFVGLGCPKQELWICDHYRELRIPMLAVGAAFDFIAGTKPQAPVWMQRNGLEWFFRLMTEPRRLWRRYLLGNPLFLCLLAAQFTGLRSFNPPRDATDIAS